MRFGFLGRPRGKFGGLPLGFRVVERAWASREKHSGGVAVAEAAGIGGISAEVERVLVRKRVRFKVQALRRDW